MVYSKNQIAIAAWPTGIVKCEMLIHISA
jgi:hypothetical protein